MIGTGYPATLLLRRLTAAHGWSHELARDAHGEPIVVVAVRIGSTWTDSVAIAGENETLAMRHRTNDDRLILQTELHGRCEDVLAELFELLDPGPMGTAGVTGCDGTREAAKA